LRSRSVRFVILNPRDVAFVTKPGTAHEGGRGDGVQPQLTSRVTPCDRPPRFDGSRHCKAGFRALENPNPKARMTRRLPEPLRAQWLKAEFYTPLPLRGQRRVSPASQFSRQ
jgi:hypothetical protein